MSSQWSWKTSWVAVACSCVQYEQRTSLVKCNTELLYKTRWGREAEREGWWNQNRTSTNLAFSLSFMALYWSISSVGVVEGVVVPVPDGVGSCVGSCTGSI